MKKLWNSLIMILKWNYSLMKRNEEDTNLKFGFKVLSGMVIFIPILALFSTLGSMLLIPMLLSGGFKIAES